VRPSRDEGEAVEAAVPLDLLLTQAAVGPLRRLSPGLPGVRFLGGLAQRPDRVSARIRELGGSLAQIAVGASDVAPSGRDKRFADPAWTQNPLLRRLVQAYLAVGETVEGLLQNVPMRWQDAERVRFAATNLVDALAPSNNPLVSPVAWKAFIDSGGTNVVRGPRNLVRDLASAPRVPTMVDPDAYRVGTDLAVRRPRPAPRAGPGPGASSRSRSTGPPSRRCSCRRSRARTGPMPR
jgi:polyhydroxyalkanoate synthase subunit PhaC